MNNQKETTVDTMVEELNTCWDKEKTVHYLCEWIQSKINEEPSLEELKILPDMIKATAELIRSR